MLPAVFTRVLAGLVQGTLVKSTPTAGGNEPWWQSPRDCVWLRRSKHLWEREVELKQALGVPASVFSRGPELVRAEDR